MARGSGAKALVEQVKGAHQKLRVRSKQAGPIPGGEFNRRRLDCVAVRRGDGCAGGEQVWSRWWTVIGSVQLCLWKGLLFFRKEKKGEAVRKDMLEQF